MATHDQPYIALNGYRVLLDRPDLPSQSGAKALRLSLATFDGWCQGRGDIQGGDGQPAHGLMTERGR